MTNEVDLTWRDFCRSFTRRELLQEFLEALQRLEQYRDAHPTALPGHVTAAVTCMRAMGEQLRHMVNDPAHYATPAPPEAVAQVLAMVRMVKRPSQRVDSAKATPKITNPRTTRRTV